MYNMKNLILALSFLSLSGVSAQSAMMYSSISKPFITASLGLVYDINNEKFDKRFDPIRAQTVGAIKHEVDIPEDSVIKEARWFMEDGTEVNCELASEGVKLSEIRNFVVFTQGVGTARWFKCTIDRQK